MPLPMQRDQVLGVMVQSSSAPDTQVLKMQGWDGAGSTSGSSCRARSAGRRGPDGGACWLMLNRYAAEYTPTGQRTGMGAAVPDWISAGLAQNAQAALRSRNRDWIARELADGEPHPAAGAGGQAGDAAAGPLARKGLCRRRRRIPLSRRRSEHAGRRCSRPSGTRQAIDAAWLRKNCAGAAGPESGRRPGGSIWRSVPARTAEAWSDRGLQIEEKLLQTLNFRPRDWAAPCPTTCRRSCSRAI
jgi:hypothetical protein